MAAQSCRLRIIAGSEGTPKTHPSGDSVPLMGASARQSLLAVSYDNEGLHEAPIPENDQYFST